MRDTKKEILFIIHDGELTMENLDMKNIKKDDMVAITTIFSYPGWYTNKESKLYLSKSDAYLNEVTNKWEFDSSEIIPTTKLCNMSLIQLPIIVDETYEYGGGI